MVLISAVYPSAKSCTIAPRSEGPMQDKPERRARQTIDQLPSAAGWQVLDRTRPASRPPAAWPLANSRSTRVTVSPATLVYVGMAGLALLQQWVESCPVVPEASGSRTSVLLSSAARDRS